MRFNIFKSIISLAILIWLVAVAGTVTARADVTEVMYAVDGHNGNETRLHILSPATGEVIQTIGPIGFPNVTGIAFHPITGLLYGVTSGFTTGPGSPIFGAELITIDRVTGQGTLVANFNNADIDDIAFDSTGTLYAWVFGIPPATCCGFLFTIDLTSGAFNLVGQPAFAPLPFKGGLAFDSSDNLFVKTQFGLHSVDKITGTSTGFLSLSGPEHLNGLTFDSSGKLFTIGRFPGSGGLLTIDQIPGPNVNLVGLNSLIRLSAIESVSTDLAAPLPQISIVKTLVEGPLDGNAVLIEDGGLEVNPNDAGGIWVGLTETQRYKFTIKITNDGTAAANVVITDVVPAEYDLDPGLHEDDVEDGGINGLCDGGTPTCEGDSGTFLGFASNSGACVVTHSQPDSAGNPSPPPTQPEFFDVNVTDLAGGAMCTVTIYVKTDENPGNHDPTLFEPTSCREIIANLFDTITLNDGVKVFDKATGFRVSGPEGSLQLTCNFPD